MKYLSSLLLLMLVSVCASAKIWRVNNNAGVNADYTTAWEAINAATAGDTIHLESSTTAYATNSLTLTKKLIFIGPGYFLNPANTNEPYNPGLQAVTIEGMLPFMRIGAGADGTKFLGVTFVGSVYMNGGDNISFERVYFFNGIYFESAVSDNVSVRKCFFLNSGNINSTSSVVVTNFTAENNIFYNSYINMPILSGSNNVIRNNSFYGGSGVTLQNAYFANNILYTTYACNFTNCTIKNNLFQANQTLPGTATNNQVNVNMANVFVGGTTGSLDSRVVLKAGSPAIGAGLTVGAVTNPDCGAYGATESL
ncbi:MAG: hypothetical protein QM726_18230 [Chitinophagaceae bacterium]